MAVHGQGRGAQAALEPPHDDPRGHDGGGEDDHCRVMELLPGVEPSLRRHLGRSAEHVAIEALEPGDIVAVVLERFGDDLLGAGPVEHDVQDWHRHKPDRGDAVQVSRPAARRDEGQRAPDKGQAGEEQDQERDCHYRVDDALAAPIAEDHLFAVGLRHRRALLLRCRWKPWSCGSPRSPSSPPGGSSEPSHRGRRGRRR